MSWSNPSEWVLKISPNKLLPDGLDLRIEPYTIIAGFNATAKSIIARTIYALAKNNGDELRRLWRDKGAAKICLSTRFGAPCYDSSSDTLKDPLKDNVVYAELLPDSRIFMREAYSIIDVFREYGIIEGMLDRICNEIPGELGEPYSSLHDECRKAVSRLKQNTKSLEKAAFVLVRKLKALKQSSNDDDLIKLKQVYREVMRKAIGIVNDALRKIGEEDIRPEDLDPFEISLLPWSENEIRVVDKRFGSKDFIRLDTLSTSIASYLSIQVAMHVLSQPLDNILLVVEEPEEGLAPPQQYLFSYLLGVFAQSLDKDVRIIVTTHSPYVVYGAINTGATVYYSRYSWEKKGFVVARDRPYTIFALADKIALLLKK